MTVKDKDFIVKRFRVCAESCASQLNFSDVMDSNNHDLWVRVNTIYNAYIVLLHSTTRFSGNKELCRLKDVFCSDYDLLMTCQDVPF